MRTTLLLAALLVTAPAVASAQPAIAVDPEPAAPRDHRFELETGVTMSIANLGDHSITGWGPGVTAGYRAPDGLALLASAGLMQLSATEYPGADSDNARALRLGGAVRQSVATLTPGIEMDMSLELAAERRYLRWSGGGRLTRDVVTAGFILNMDARDLRGKPRHNRRGLHYAIRMGAATAPPGHGRLDFITIFGVGMYFSP